MRNQRIALIIKQIAAGVLVLAAVNGQAAEKELLDILLSNGAITQAQYDELLAKEELEQIDVAEISFGGGSGFGKFGLG